MHLQPRALVDLLAPLVVVLQIVPLVQPAELLAQLAHPLVVRACVVLWVYLRIDLGLQEQEQELAHEVPVWFSGAAWPREVDSKVQMKRPEAQMIV